MARTREAVTEEGICEPTRLQRLLREPSVFEVGQEEGIVEPVRRASPMFEAMMENSLRKLALAEMARQFGVTGYENALEEVQRGADIKTRVDIFGRNDA